MSDYLVINAGGFERRAAISVSTGAADAGKITKTGSNGLHDNSLINWAAPGAIGTTTANNASLLQLDFGQASGFNTPTFTTRSTGTRILLFGQLSATTVDYAIGIGSGTFWQSVPGSSQNFRWFVGTTNVLSLLGSGRCLLGSSVTDDAANLLQVGGGLRTTGTAQLNALRVTSSGSNLTRLLTATTVLDFGSLATGGQQTSGNLALSGAQVGDTVIVNPSGAPPSGVIFDAWVDTTNNVRIRATNTSSVAVDPPSQTFRVAVMGWT